MEKKDYLAPQIKVKLMVEEENILAASAPSSITVSDDPNDVIDQGYVDAKGHHSYGVWDEDEDEELK